MYLIKIDRDVFLKPLLSVTGIVERRHTLPILSNVLISRNGNMLSFVATDLEIQVTATTECLEGGPDFSITTSAKKLQDICRSLPEESLVELESGQDHKLTLRAGKSRFNLQSLPAEDFPTFSVGGETVGRIRIPQRDFKHLLAKVQFAMAQQDIRYYLNALLFVVEPGQVKLVATDGHRLSLASMALDTPVEGSEVIIPRKTVIELSKLLSDTEDELEIWLGGNQIRFVFGNTVIVSKVVDGKFPDYNKVIPVGHTNHFTISRAVLQQTLQRTSILSNEKFRGVRLVLTQNSLRIICTNSEQEEAQEELEIDYSGDPLDIGFNVTYLLDVLGNLDVPEIECYFSDANSSGLITVPGSDNFKYVVMPMRI